MTSQELHKGTNYLLKSAGALGRIANMFSIPNQAVVDNPVRGMLGHAIPVPILNEMAARRFTMGGTEQDIAASIDKQQGDLKRRSLLGSMAHGAKQLAKPSAIAGGAAGGFIGLNTAAEEGANPMLGALLGGGTGLAIGGLAGGIIGGGMGGISKLVQENTSKDSQQRAKKMLATHPYMTSPPLYGNLIGGALA